MASEIKTNKKLHSESPKTIFKRLILDLLAVGVAIIFLFPIYWLLISSFKTDMEVFEKTVSYWPKNFTLAPWAAQLTDVDFLSSMRNSFVIAFSNMAISTVMGTMAAYGIARFHFPFKRIIILMFLVTQMMPCSMLLTPLYLMFSSAKMLNTYQAPVFAIATVSIPFIIVTLRPYFLSLPKSLDEAARIDGCNAFTSFLYIMIPVARVGLITCLVFGFLHGWNDLVYSMTFNVKASMRPLTANIYKFVNKYGTKWNMVMAYGMILVLPVLLIFVFLQKYIVGGLTSGAVKE